MAKYAAKGAILEISDGAPTPTWTPIANLEDISHSGGEADRIDVTTHDSTGGYREFVAGFKGEATLQFGITYDPDHASHWLLATLYGSGDVKPMRLKLPPDFSANQITWSGFVSNFQVPSLPVSDKMSTQVSIQVTGAITFPTS